MSTSLKYTPANTAMEREISKVPFKICAAIATIKIVRPTDSQSAICNTNFREVYLLLTQRADALAHYYGIRETGSEENRHLFFCSFPATMLEFAQNLLQEQYESNFVFQIRIGLDWGSVSLEGDTILGDAVHRARSITDSFLGTGIVVSNPFKEALNRETGSLHPYQHWTMSEISLKGFSKPMRLWSVRSSKTLRITI